MLLLNIFFLPPSSLYQHFAIPDQPTLIFVFSALSIIPLAALLGFATEELALRVGDTLGGLLNASFGNATEVRTILEVQTYRP
jgi:Ca2+:H+ antiporter